MEEIIEFLRRLAAHNEREWFNAHKEEYLRVKDEVESFAEKLISGVAEFEPMAALLKPADCLYRIYRDTRFSNDKRPYKNHIGIYVNPHGGKKSEFCGYYLHIEPDNCLVGGGAWCPEAPLLKEYRKEIYSNIEEYLGIIQNPEFEAVYSPYMQDELKSAPKGYPKDWEYIDLLKPRSFTVSARLTEQDMCSKQAIEKICGLFRIMKPYNDFFNFTLEEHSEFAVRTPRRR